MAEPKKQVPLRLNAKLYDALAAWAEDDFRSVNGQIEYLLTECVRQRKKNGKYVSDQIDVPPELDIQNKIPIRPRLWRVNSAWPGFVFICGSLKAEKCEISCRKITKIH